MPAPGRQQVDYTDIGYDGITLKIDGTSITYDVTKPNGIGVAAGAGLAVSLSADDTAQLTNDGDCVIGKLLKVAQDGFCSVAFKGFQPFAAGNAATVTRGRGIVGALGAAAARGYVRQTISPGAAYTQTEQVEQNRSRGRIWAIADLTNVWVDLGA